MLVPGVWRLFGVADALASFNWFSCTGLVAVLETFRLSLVRFFVNANIFEDLFGSWGIMRLTRDFCGTGREGLEDISLEEWWFEKRSKILEMRRIDGLLADLMSRVPSSLSSSEADMGNVGWKHRLFGRCIEDILINKGEIQKTRS